VEEKSSYGNYLYGSTSAGGNTRGVLFRLRLDQVPGSPPFEVVYAFPSQWSVAGSFPASTMLAANDKTYGLTFYGTTWTGGTYNYGALFRLSGVHLPSMQNLPVPVFYALRSDSKHVGKVFQIPGEPQPTTIDMYSGATARMGSVVGPTTDNGMMIRIGNCRSPHVVQFIAREIIEADGTYKAGTYNELSGRSYQFTLDDKNPLWDTDSSAHPNAYYDAQVGTPNTINPLNLIMFDQPNFSQGYYLPNVHETWRTRIKDYVICNCQLVSEVLWTREVPWIPDSPTGNNVTVDINKGHQGPPAYVNMSIISLDDTVLPLDDPLLQWVNSQVQKDGFQPVP
jgi:hypothetical protein